MTNSIAADPAAVQRRIDRYLKEVDDALKEHGASWGDRNSIRENIQTQIREMLEARAGATPTAEDADAVIAKLDAPQSYVAGIAGDKPLFRENPLRPLYLLLSYIFLFGFVIGILGLIRPIMQAIQPSTGEIVTKTPIILIVFSLVSAVICFSIAYMFRRAADKKIRN